MDIEERKYNMMNKTLELAGINHDDLMKRLMNNAVLLKVILQKFIADTNFPELKAAFAAADYKKAELCSHTLKGMCGNCSHKKLFELFSEQTNLIRSGEYTMAADMMKIIEPIYEAAIENIKIWISEN